jgi:hypothetical protein
MEQQNLDRFSEMYCARQKKSRAAEAARLQWLDY